MKRSRVISGLALIFNRDGQPGSPVILERMMRRMGHRGADGVSRVQEALIGIGHQHFWTTPEEAGEEQPLRSENGRFLLAFDGRLDNRRELIKSLGFNPGELCHLSDAALVLLCYERWGQDCLERFLGPFSLALVDTQELAVICARDPLGGRTLFYHLNDRLLVLASEESALLAHPSVSDQLDETRIILHFAIEVPLDGSTFFQSVKELLPGQRLRVAKKGTQISPFWSPPETKRVRYSTDREYAEHFGALLKQSVERRSRTLKTPMVLMSGGLDSTSVASLAVQAQTACSGLSTISWVFDELESCDERRFINSVNGFLGTQTIQVQADDAWPLARLHTWPFNPNTPEENPYRLLKERVYQRVSKLGTRTLLTGAFGDNLYSGAQHWFGDLVRGGQILRASNEIRERIWRLGFKGLTRTVFRRLAGGPQSGPNDRFSWLADDCQRRLIEVFSQPPSKQGIGTKGRENILGPRSAHNCVGELFHGGRHSIDLRHPYRDRELIEFMLGVPACQLYQGGQYKHVLRHAMLGRLPELVRTRQGPTSLRPLFVRGVEEREIETVEGLLTTPDVQWPQYLKQSWVRKALSRSDTSSLEKLVLWQCLSFELWQRRRRASATETALQERVCA